MLTSGLPIDATLPALREALARSSSAVLQAPPGAGKSTVVPLALLEEPWARGRRILMLEPRRLAARAVAQRMSQTLRETVGRTVGYRMRMDTRVSRDTRIEVVTEGVLTRMLQNDPALEGIAAVIFDEFHERSLQADLGLSFLFISHDIAVVERISHFVGVMYLGRLVEVGPRPAVFEDARHPYTKTLMAAVPVADPRRRRIHESPSSKPLASPIYPLGYQAKSSTYDEVTPGHFVLRQS